MFIVADIISISYILLLWSLFCLFLSGRFTQALLYYKMGTLEHRLAPVWGIETSEVKFQWANFIRFSELNAKASSFCYKRAL